MECYFLPHAGLHEHTFKLKAAQTTHLTLAAVLGLEQKMQICLSTVHEQHPKTEEVHLWDLQGEGIYLGQMGS